MKVKSIFSHPHLAVISVFAFTVPALLCQPSYARLVAKHLIGTEKVIGTEVQFSLVRGWLLLETALPKWRLVGNYGEKHKDFSCNTKITKTDCPQDHFSALLKILFPIPESMLIPSGAPNFPAPSLTFKGLGKLLAALRSEKVQAKELQSFLMDKKLYLDNIQLRKDQVKDLATAIAGALSETRSHRLVYPPHLVEHTLLAFFAARANTTQDVVELFEGLYDGINDPKELWTSLENFDRHDLAVIFQEFADRFKIPAPIRFEQGTNRCGEQLLRNFFDALNYKDIVPKSIDLDPRIPAFYGLNNPSTEAWISLFQEKDFPQVKFVKIGTGCAIEPSQADGIHNILMAVNRLLYSANHVLSPIAKESPNLHNMLKEMSKALSRDDLELTSKLEEYPTGKSVLFFINHQLSFTWKSTDPHFELERVAAVPNPRDNDDSIKKLESWRKETGREEDPNSYALALPYVDTTNLPSLTKRYGETMTLGLPLHSLADAAQMAATLDCDSPFARIVRNRIIDTYSPKKKNGLLFEKCPSTE